MKSAVPDKTPDPTEDLIQMAPEVGTEVIQQIVGEQLSGVTFLEHYLQLQFNPPPIINAYTPVAVTSPQHRSTSGDDQFRNRLCEQIGKTVRSTAIDDRNEFLITFDDGSAISISLKPRDRDLGPEALAFIGREDVRMAI